MQIFEDDIGKKVAKHSGKPFKSGQKVNTLRGIINHPILHVPAYIFNEDDSYVRASYCHVIDNIATKIEGNIAMSKVVIKGLNLTNESIPWLAIHIANSIYHLTGDQYKYCSESYGKRALASAIQDHLQYLVDNAICK
jgi:hypothetical protein